MRIDFPYGISSSADDRREAIGWIRNMSILSLDDNIISIEFKRLSHVIPYAARFLVSANFHFGISLEWSGGR